MVLNLNKLKPCKNNSWVRKRLGLSPVKKEIMMAEEETNEEASGEEVGKDNNAPENSDDNPTD